MCVGQLEKRSHLRHELVVLLPEERRVLRLLGQAIPVARDDTARPQPADDEVHGGGERGVLEERQGVFEGGGLEEDGAEEVADGSRALGCQQQRQPSDMEPLARGCAWLAAGLLSEGAPKASAVSASVVFW